MTQKLKVLDLFSGIGGFSLGLERTGGFETVAFCEINAKRRQDIADQWPGIPIFDDVRNIHRKSYRGVIDVITGGFPCQDISIAGKREGIQGTRSNLFYQIIRLLRIFRPRYAILENSADLLTGANGAWASAVFGALAKIRYNAEWHVIPASGLGAPHERERVWIVATDARSGLKRSTPLLGRRFTRTGKTAAIVAYDYCERELQSGWSFRDKRGRVVHDPFKAWPETWVEKLSHLRSLDDGVSSGFSNQTAGRFGNTVIPQIPELIGYAILEAMKNEQ